MQFADLHDTPGRMEARGAIRKAVPWAESRSFFYWRLRRRLAEFDLRKQVRQLCPTHHVSSNTPVMRTSRFFLFEEKLLFVFAKELY